VLGPDEVSPELAAAAGDGGTESGLDRSEPALGVVLSPDPALPAAGGTLLEPSPAGARAASGVAIPGAGGPLDERAEALSSRPAVPPWLSLAATPGEDSGALDRSLGAPTGPVPFLCCLPL